MAPHPIDDHLSVIQRAVYTTMGKAPDPRRFEGDELVSECYVDLRKNFHSYDPARGPLANWIFVAACRRTRELMGLSRAGAPLVGREPNTRSLNGADAAIRDTSMERAARRVEAGETVAQLRPTDRDLAERRVAAGSNRGLGAQLGITSQGVGLRLAKIRRRVERKAA